MFDMVLRYASDMLIIIQNLETFIQVDRDTETPGYLPPRSFLIILEKVSFQISYPGDLFGYSITIKDRTKAPAYLPARSLLIMEKSIS